MDSFQFKWIQNNHSVVDFQIYF